MTGPTAPIAPAQEVLSPVTVRHTKVETLQSFFAYNGYDVDHDVNNNPRLLRVRATPEAPQVWVVIGDAGIHFEALAGNVGELAEVAGLTEMDFTKALLRLNAEILPVSIALNENDEVLIVESRERENLDANELQAVFDAIDIAFTKLEQLLTATDTDR